MVLCRLCQIYIGTDKRRRYCDDHREYRRGKWRCKGSNAEYFRKNKRKYSMRQTRITGSGFSEHLICDKTGKANFRKERIAVRKERKRMGI